MRSPKLPTLVSVVFALALFAPQVLLAQYAISTIAGGGPNNLTALSASIGFPASVASDSSGNTYIADPFSSHIFKVDTTGNLTVVAGNGTFGYSGDGGPATSATLNHPLGVFVDGSGNIFIADTDNCLVRKVSSGTISTVAGNPAVTLPCGYSGDGGPATTAQLFDPTGVFVDSSENIFIADTDNCLIREVSGGIISTVAGNPLATPTPCGYSGDGAATSETLDEPEGVFVVAGNIYIADTDNNLIRVVNTGTAQVTIAGVSIPAGYIGTVAGAYYDSQVGEACGYSNDGTTALTTYLCVPNGVFVDASGNIFIADTNDFVISEVAANQTAPYQLTNVAGTLGVGGYSNGTSAITAELNYPSNMAVDGSGNIWIADTDNFVIRVVDTGTAPVTIDGVTIQPSDIATIIGNNIQAYSGDGGLAVNAELYSPGAVAADTLGDVFIADTSNNLIRVANTGTTANIVAGVTIQPGDIQTVVGSYYVPVGDALCDYSGDSGPPLMAQLCAPGGVFVDALGNIFIADTQNNRIRVVNTGAAALTYWGLSATPLQPGEIATVAGNGTLCTAAPCGDGGAATSAALANPNGVFVDSAENIFIADTDDYVIREVAASSGTISRVAGNYSQCIPTAPPSCGDTGTATSAQLNFPYGVFVDLSENVYIADTFDNSIRVAVNPSATQPVTIAGVTIPPGDIATVAGTGTRGYAGDGGPSTSANLDTPNGVFVDNSGDIFIADTDNAAIREVVAATGFIQTVAGTPTTPGFSGDGGPATSAELSFPLGVFGNSAGNLFIADTDNQRIRELVPAIFVTVAPISVNVAVGTQQTFTATVTGTGNTFVNWYVNGVLGGNVSTTGSISTTGIFQAPATIPSPATVTITAISAEDNTTSGFAQATIVGAGGAVNVAVTTNPPVSEVYTGTVQVFIATVTGTSNTAVTWQVNGVPGGNATVGTIDTSGNYTGPSVVPTPNPSVVIEAISQALSSAIGAESVLIVSAPVAGPLAGITISPGQTATYPTATLTAGTGDPRYPIKLSCSPSTLPPNATCTFTPPTIIPGNLQQDSFVLAIAVPTGSASLEKPKGMRLLFYCLFLPLAGILFAGIGLQNQRRNKRFVWLWLAGLCVFLILLNACGGGSNSTPVNPELGTYNIKVQGTTAAQPNPVTITVAGLTVAQ